MLRTYFVIAIAVIALPASASNLYGNWLMEMQVGSELNQFVMYLNADGFEVHTSSSSGYQTGLIERSSADSLKLVVVDYEPKQHDGQALGMPPDRLYTIVELGDQKLVLFDRICAVWMDAENCTFTWIRQ